MNKSRHGSWRQRPLGPAALVAGVLFTAALVLAIWQLTIRHGEQPAPNPLRELKRIHVILEAESLRGFPGGVPGPLPRNLRPTPGTDAPVMDTHLRASIVDRLQEAGLSVVTDNEILENKAGDFAYLRVRQRTVPAEKGATVFQTRTELDQPVLLPGSRAPIRAVTWSSEVTVVEQSPSLAAATRKKVLQAVDAFLVAYRSAHKLSP